MIICRFKIIAEDALFDMFNAIRLCIFYSGYGDLHVLLSIGLVNFDYFCFTHNSMLTESSRGLYLIYRN